MFHTYTRPLFVLVWGCSCFFCCFLFLCLQFLGRVLGFLPELKKGREWFAYLENLCRQPWFWGDTSSRAAYKALVPAPSRSFMVRFSGQAPWYTISFKEKGGNVLHRRIIRNYGEEAVKFENGDIHPRAGETFPSLPHMISAIQPLMRWKPLQGGPTWWIFHEQESTGDNRALGGYGGYFRGECLLLLHVSRLSLLNGAEL